MSDSSTIIARFGSEGNDALQRFMTGLAGSAERLKLMETAAYQASRASTLFSSELAAHPVRTLKAYSDSTEKAAIATAYFREQLAFLAASRFGSIILFSTILGGIAVGVSKLVKTNLELDTAIHRVASAFIEEQDVAKRYGEIQSALINTSLQFGKTYKENAEVLWELKSAGLSVSQTYAGIETVMKLLAAGATDVNMTTRMTAGLYRAFGNEVKGAATEAQKFAEIGGSVVYVLNQSQADLDNLMQSYKYAAGIAKQTGMSLAEVNAVLTVTNNALLFGSTAGTGFAQAILNVATNWRKFARDFDVAIDPNKPLKFIDFINQLAKNQDLLNSKVSAMGQLSEDSNVRALRVLVANVQGVKDLNKAYSDLSQEGLAKYLDKASGERMADITTQWQRMKEVIKGQFQLGEDWKVGMASILQFTNNYAEAEQRIADAYANAGDWSQVAHTKAIAYISYLKGSGETWQQILAYARSLSQTDPFDKAAQSGPAIIAQNKTIYKTIQDVFSNEENLRVMMLGKVQILDEQVEKTRLLLIEAEKQAIAEANINAKSQEAIKAKEKVLTLMEKLTGLEERQKTAALDNLHTLEEFQKKVLSAKGLTPADEIARNNNALMTSVAILGKTTAGSQEWRKAVGDVGAAVLTVANNYKIVQGAVEKALAAQDAMNKAVVERADQMAKRGDTFGAEQLLRQQAQEVELAARLANTDEQRLEALKQQAEIQKKRLDIDATNYQASRQYDEAQEQIAQTLTAIRDRHQEIAEIVQSQWKSGEEETGKVVSKIASDMDLWNVEIKSAASLVSDQLNAGLAVTKGLIEDITARIKEMSRKSNRKLTTCDNRKLTTLSDS